MCQYLRRKCTCKEHELVSQRSITSNTHEMMIEQQCRKKMLVKECTQHKQNTKHIDGKCWGERTNILLHHTEVTNQSRHCLFSSTFLRCSFVLSPCIHMFSFPSSCIIYILWKKDLFLSIVSTSLYAVFLYSSHFSLWSWTEPVRKQQVKFCCYPFARNQLKNIFNCVSVCLSLSIFICSACVEVCVCVFDRILECDCMCVCGCFAWFYYP